jgi:hypothetical protein
MRGKSMAGSPSTRAAQRSLFNPVAFPDLARPFEGTIDEETS